MGAGRRSCPASDEADILGIEAPIWTETIATIAEVEFMAFPRIAAIAEIAWSPAGTRDHEEFFVRVAWLGAHLDALGVTYYPVRGVPWAESAEQGVGDALPVSAATD